MANPNKSPQGVGMKPVKYSVPFIIQPKILLQDMWIRSVQSVKIPRDGVRKEALLTYKRTEQKG
jgi:hypothetical protein